MIIPLSQVRNSLLSKTGGRAQANIPNFYSMLQETAWMMMGQADLPSSIRIEPFVNPLVNPLYETTGTIVLPDDFSLDGLIAIRRQDITQRTAANTFINANQWNGEQMLFTSTIQIQNGIQTLATRLDLPAPTIVDTLESLSTGVFTAVGATSAIAVDSTYYIAGSGSISFLAGAGSSNGLQALFTTPTSIIGLENVLLWVNTPANDARIRISVGSDAANYFYQNLTSTYFNQSFKTGWNLLRLDLSAAGQIGTPNMASIKFLKVEPLDTLAAPVTYRIDSLMGTGDAFVNLEYYSNSIFMNQAGQRISLPSADTDSLILNDKEYPLFLRQFAEISNTDVRPNGAATQLAVYGGTRLDGMYENFRQQFPSRRIWQGDDYSSGASGSFYVPIIGYGSSI